MLLVPISRSNCIRLWTRQCRCGVVDSHSPQVWLLLLLAVGQRTTTQPAREGLYLMIGVLLHVVHDNVGASPTICAADRGAGAGQLTAMLGIWRTPQLVLVSQPWLVPFQPNQWWSWSWLEWSGVELVRAPNPLRRKSRHRSITTCCTAAADSAMAGCTDGSRRKEGRKDNRFVLRSGFTSPALTVRMWGVKAMPHEPARFEGKSVSLGLDSAGIHGGRKGAFVFLRGKWYYLGLRTASSCRSRVAGRGAWRSDPTPGCWWRSRAAGALAAEAAARRRRRRRRWGERERHAPSGAYLRGRPRFCASARPCPSHCRPAAAARAARGRRRVQHGPRVVVVLLLPRAPFPCHLVERQPHGRRRGVGGRRRRCCANGSGGGGGWDGGGAGAAAGGGAAAAGAGGTVTSGETSLASIWSDLALARCCSSSRFACCTAAELSRGGSARKQRVALTTLLSFFSTLQEQRPLARLAAN